MSTNISSTDGSLYTSTKSTPLLSLAGDEYVKVKTTPTSLYNPESEDVYFQQPTGEFLFNLTVSDVSKEIFQAKLLQKMDQMFGKKGKYTTRPLNIDSGDSKTELRVLLPKDKAGIDRTVLYQMGQEFLSLFPKQTDPTKQLCIKFLFERNNEIPKNRENVVLIFNGYIVEYPSKHNESREKISFSEPDKNPRTVSVTKVTETIDNKGSFLVFGKPMQGMMKYVSRGEYDTIRAKFDYKKENNTKNTSLDLYVTQSVTTATRLSKVRVIEEKGTPGNRFLKDYQKDPTNPLSTLNMLLYSMLLLEGLSRMNKIGVALADLKFDNTIIRFKTVTHNGKTFQLVDETIPSDSFWRFDLKSDKSREEQTALIPKGSSRATVFFTSPEYSEDETNYTHKTDIWSFLMMLAEVLLTGVGSISCGDSKQHPLPSIYNFKHIGRSHRFSAVTKPLREMDDTHIEEAIKVLTKNANRGNLADHQKMLYQFFLGLHERGLKLDVEERFSADEGIIASKKMLEEIDPDTKQPRYPELQKMWADPVKYATELLAK